MVLVNSIIPNGIGLCLFYWLKYWIFKVQHTLLVWEVWVIYQVSIYLFTPLNKKSGYRLLLIRYPLSNFDIHWTIPLSLAVNSFGFRNKFSFWLYLSFLIRLLWNCAIKFFLNLAWTFFLFVLVLSVCIFLIHRRSTDMNTFYSFIPKILISCFSIGFPLNLFFIFGGSS